MNLTDPHVLTWVPRTDLVFLFTNNTPCQTNLTSHYFRRIILAIFLFTIIIADQFIVIILVRIVFLTLEPDLA